MKRFLLEYDEDGWQPVESFKFYEDAYQALLDARHDQSPYFEWRMVEVHG